MLFRSGKMKYKYKIDITWDPEDEIYVARVPELDGCMSHGKNEFEALKNVSKAMEGWIRTARQFKMEIPEPIPTRKFSGTFNVRIPKETHQNLAMKAVEEHVSLNLLVSKILTRAI